jgi:hypothetical protein
MRRAGGPYSVWCAARPCGVAATITDAHLASHQHLTGPEAAPVRATLRRLRDPLPGCRWYRLVRRALLLDHPASQGALVTILWLWALSTEPPQRAVMMLAAPPVMAILPSVALTMLKLPMYTCAELLLVARTVLKEPS